MFSIKMVSYLRVIRKIHSNKLFSSPICTFRNKSKEMCIYNIKSNVFYNTTVLAGRANFVRYSSGPIQIPPPPPPPPPESEVFGSIGGLKYEKVELDEEELKEEERSKTAGGQVPRKFKPSPGQYAKMIKNYLDKGDLRNAEEVIAECKRNRDHPTPYMYNLIIRAFAMQGDIKSCFRYYSEMKSRHYKIKANTYTSLFNACANSPDSNKALDYLKRIRTFMSKTQCKIENAHYNVLVKAYGRHHKLEEANKIIQEMIEKKLKLGISTINSLMYACNSDTESGLKHILHMWQLMRQQKIPPDIFTYNLMLRAIRDTKFGDCSVHDLLLPYKECPAIITDNNRPDLLMYPPVLSSLPLPNVYKETNPVSGLLDVPKTKTSIESVLIESNPKDVEEGTPVNDLSDVAKTKSSNESDLIESNPKEAEETSSVETTQMLPPSIANLNLDAILKQNKLILFGGVEGLLQKMKYDRIEPNVKTITYLMELCPDSTAAEETVIKYAKSLKIPLDIDFFNMLIKKRCLRDAKNEAKEVLDYIHQADLQPNIITYGCLSLACTTTNDSRLLLDTLKTTGLTINKYIADAILSRAFLNRDFIFILEVMERMKRERVRLDESTFEKLDEFQQKMSELQRMKHKSAQKDYFKIGFSKFNMRYKDWQKEMGRKIVMEKE